MKKPLILHPFLFSIWLVLILFVENIEAIALKYLLFTILLVLLLVIICLAVDSLLFKDIYVNALVVSPAVIVLFSGGKFYVYLRDYYLPLVPIVAILGTILYVLYCIKILRSLAPGELKKITSTVNIVASLLVIFNISQILYYYCYKSNKLSAYQHESNFNYRFSGTPPDIYYIILDMYAGLDQIKTTYKYDNEAFADRLTKKGFYIARNSETKYPFTTLSLSTSLNMEFPQNIPPEEIAKGSDSPFGGELVRKNKVAHILKSLNYTYYHLGSWFYVTRYNGIADYNINYNGFNINNPLILDLINSSLIRLLFISAHFEREVVFNTLASLSKIAEADGPKFIFCHIICPHGPFLFGPEGEPVPYNKRYDINDRSVYLAQYIFITNKIEEVIDNILKKSKNSPIIILQSDHSIFWEKLWIKRIFNAYLLPHNGKALLNDSFSPVNTFRLIFNYYYGAKYDLIDDVVSREK